MADTQDPDVVKEKNETLCQKSKYHSELVQDIITNEAGDAREVSSHQKNDTRLNYEANTTATKEDWAKDRTNFVEEALLGTMLESDAISDKRIAGDQGKDSFEGVAHGSALEKISVGDINVPIKEAINDGEPFLKGKITSIQHSSNRTTEVKEEGQKTTNLLLSEENRGGEAAMILLSMRNQENSLHDKIESSADRQAIFILCNLRNHYDSAEKFEQDSITEILWSLRIPRLGANEQESNVQGKVSHKRKASPMLRERSTRVRRASSRYGAEDAFKQTQGKPKSPIATSEDSEELDKKGHRARTRDKISQTPTQSMVEAESVASESRQEFVASHLSVKGHQTRGAPSLSPNIIAPRIQYREHQIDSSTTRNPQDIAGSGSNGSIENYYCHNCDKCAADETDEDEQGAPDDKNINNDSSSSFYDPTE